MSFFVKCPQQRPVQGRFKTVQMYCALEDKDMLPFGLEQFGLELTAERLRAERLCIILKRPTTVNVSVITKKDIPMLLKRCVDFYTPKAY